MRTFYDVEHPWMVEHNGSDLNKLAIINNCTVCPNFIIQKLNWRLGL